MRSVKGLHDIATHGSLAKEGRLFSLARGNYQLANDRVISEAPGWDVKRHIIGRPAKPLNFAKLMEREIEFTQGMLQEFDEAFVEGMPVSGEAYERLKMRLAKLKGYAK